MLRAYRVYAAKAPGKEGGYTVDHSSILYVMDPRGRFAANLTHEAPPERIAAFAAIVERAGYPSPVRTPRGRDILAACGQLKTASERRRRRRAAEAATAAA